MISSQGWVEVRWPWIDEELGAPWRPAVFTSGIIVDDTRSVLGPLFGVRKCSDFVPVAEARGLPEDVSDEVRADAADKYADEAHSHTWVTWGELEAVDWSEVGLDGLAYEETLGDQQSGMGLYLDRDHPQRVAGGSFELHGRRFLVRAVTRRETLEPSWETLFKLMEVLAERYGPSQVRLVIWFYD